LAISVTAQNAPGRQAGHALIRFQGLASPPTDPRFRITREGYPTANLGPHGWQVEPATLTGVLEEGGLLVGPAVTRWLEPGPVTFQLAHQPPAPLFWPDDIAPYDGPWPPPDLVPPAPPPPPKPEPKPEPKQEPSPPPVVEAPPPPPPPPPPAPPPPKPPWALIALGVFLLLAAGGGLAWWMGWLAPLTCRVAGIDCPPPPPAPTPSPAPAPAPAPTPAPAPAPPPVAGWPESSDGLPLREVVARAPNAEGILQAARRRQQQGRHDDALVLFEEAADRGIAAAMTALARMYDPVDFRRGEPFASPDPRQAARYYRDAVRAGDAAAGEPRARLRAWLEQQAAAGNATARDALSEFWP
jgi:hypothetical protein